MEDAQGLLQQGGAILIRGEEDLCALAFILEAGENDAIVYGQPGRGIVMVVPGHEVKEKIRKMIEG
jgi:uncharacterized protein (UPF0218 family)